MRTHPDDPDTSKCDATFPASGEIQQRRWLKRDGHSAKPTRLNPKRTESGDQRVQDPESGCASARTVQDQQLMFAQNGLRHDSAHTSGPDQPENRDEMDNENNQIAYEQWYTAAVNQRN